MFALVTIAGQQFKVSPDQYLYVHRLRSDIGASLEFKDVLLVANGDKTTLGTGLESAVVKAKVLSHLQGDKVIVFKKKRRKGYQKKNGHRQALTKLQIESISI